MEDNYKIERTCSNCKLEEQIIISKRQAAFGLVNIDEMLGVKCPKCSGDKFTVSYRMPMLDQEILAEWAKEERLYLAPQDEELLLADEQYLEIIFNVLDDLRTLVRKKYILLDALCVIVYDNSTVDENLINPCLDLKLKRRVLAELAKRKALLLQADSWIMDYIKKVVYPQLAIEYKKP